MSMPEPRAPLATPDARPSTEVVARPKPVRPTRTTRAVNWLGCHFGELGLTVGFGVLAVLVSPWFVLGAGFVALLWTVHEVRVRRSPRGGDQS